MKKNISQSIPAPFVKWVGGKRNILSEIEARLPEKINNYYEPFVGGGAVFFKIHKQANACYISDLNVELMNCYDVIKQQLPLLVRQLRIHQHHHSKEYFYQIRNQQELTDTVSRAARFIYLIQTCYNGLCRTNFKNQFNGSFGAYKNPIICNEANLVAVCQLLKNTDVKHQDFGSINPQAGDFVYLDPPYYNCFARYTNYGFTTKDHIRLRDFALKLSNMGVNVMISNACDRFILELFQEKYFRIETITAGRKISCKSNGRQKVAELLITNYPFRRKTSFFRTGI